LLLIEEGEKGEGKRRAMKARAGGKKYRKTERGTGSEQGR